MKISASIPDDLWNEAVDAFGTGSPSIIVQDAIKMSLTVFESEKARMTERLAKIAAECNQ